MPTDAEKDASVKRIVDIGMKRTGLIHQLADICRSIGLQCIFWDMNDCFALAAIAFLCMISVSLCVTAEIAASVLFAVSPMFYIVLTISSQWKEYMTGLYALKMTCKYTIQKIMAFRMLCFIITALPTCGISAAIFTHISGGAEFVRMLLISICSMFLSSVIMMIAVIKVKKPALYLTVPVIWGFVCIMLASIFGKAWNSFLMNLSYTVAIAVIIACTIVYLIQIKKLLDNNTEDIIYADC